MQIAAVEGSLIERASRCVASPNPEAGKNRTTLDTVSTKLEKSPGPANGFASANSHDITIAWRANASWIAQ